MLWIICVGSPSPLLHLLGVMDHMCLIPLPHYYISWVLWIICVASPSPIITSLGCYGSYVLHPPPHYYISWVLWIICGASPSPLSHLLGVMDRMCCIPLPHYYFSCLESLSSSFTSISFLTKLKYFPIKVPCQTWYVGHLGFWSTKRNINFVEHTFIWGTH